MATKTKQSKKPEKIYQEVTDRIIKALEEGTVPWQRPWKVEGLHRNLASKKLYRGINQWLLDLTAIAEGYSRPYWMTYNQAKVMGGQVRKGEKSTVVVFFKPIKIEVEEDEEKKTKTIPLLRHYNVFNVEQIEGIEDKIPQPTEHQEFKPVERAERLLKDMPNPCPVSHGGDHAYYVPLTDKMRLPSQKQFDSAEAYYAIRFHETVHSTGHESRIGRKEIEDLGEGRSSVIAYSKEELVAELGASMLCALIGLDVDTQKERSAAYIKTWIKRFKDDKRLLVSAGAAAQKACDYITGELKDDKEESSEKASTTAGSPS